MTLVTKPYSDQIAKDRNEAIDRIIQMSETPTPSDSAMTAEELDDVRRNMYSKAAWRAVPRLLAHIATLTAERTKLAADLARVEGERDALKSDRARSISRGRILIRVRDALINIKEDIESEVDRTYFGSMNDADMFCKIVDELDAFKWDRIMAEKSEPDVIEECRKANERALSAEAKSARLEEALKAAKKFVALFPQPILDDVQKGYSATYFIDTRDVAEVQAALTLPVAQP